MLNQGASEEKGVIKMAAGSQHPNSMGSQNMFGGVSGGRLAQAQKFADQGNWGQAAQQYKLGGGQFSQPQMQWAQQQYNIPQAQMGGLMGQHGPGIMGQDGPMGYEPTPPPTAGGWTPGGLLGGQIDEIDSPPQPITGGNIPGLRPDPGGMIQSPPTPPTNIGTTQPPPPPAYMGHQQVSRGRLAEAQRLAGLGQMGKAKQQWELGGGDWGSGAHKFLVS